MRTVVAFGGGVRLWIDVQGVVRARLHACATTDTAAIVKIDDSIGSPVEGSDRADFNARRGIAMITPHYRKQSRGLRKSPFFDVFDPGAIHTDGDIVLRFTRDRTRMTADTLAVVDDESVIGQSDSNLSMAKFPTF